MSRKTQRVKVEIPWELNMAIIKIQAVEELEFKEACIHASKLLDVNGGEFQRAIETKVNNIKKGLVLSEVNKSKKTWREKGYKKGYDEGMRNGYQRGVVDYRIAYTCAVCGKELIMKPKANDYEAMKQLMKQAGWAHGDCLKKP